MNNETTTYYVTVDSNDYVLSVSSQQSEGTRQVNMPNLSVNDFFKHMNLYKVHADGGIDFPDFQAATMAAQIDSLKATADEQVQTVATLTAQNQSLQKLLVGLQASFTAQIAKLQSSTK